MPAACPRPVVRRPSRLAFAATLLAVASAAASVPVATPTPPPSLGGSSAADAQAAFTRGEPLPGWALPFASVPPTTRRDPVVLRVAETQIHLGDDGDVAYLVQRALQVNDAAALSQIGQYPLYFVPQYQRIRLHAVRLLREGRTLDRTADVTVRLLDREQALERGIYSGMVTAMLVLDDVRVGDTLHLVYTLQGQNPVLGGRYSHAVAWDHAEPVELRRATLIAPRDRRIDWRLHGDNGRATVRPETLSAAGDPVTRLRFEERGIDALDEEPGVPDHHLAARFLQLTEFADWNEVARWATGLFPAAPLPEALQPLAARLRAIDDPGERAAQALRWVQEEIRYLSVSLGESSHRPSPPEQVLQRRYGDCKDKTQLLVTLLRAVGLDADAVLVASSTPKLPQRLLPHPDAFDHVVARVRIGGRVHYLDPTRLAQRGPLERLGVQEGASALVVREDTATLVELHSADPLGLASQSLDEEFRVEQLGGGGRLRMRQTWNGTHAELMRLALARMGPEARRRQVLAGYDRRYPGIRLEGEPRVVDEADANRLTMEADFEVPALTKLQDGQWTLRFYPDTVAAAIRLPEQFQRRSPVTVASVPTQARYHATVHWPAAVSMSRPAQTLRVPSPYFIGEVQRSVRGEVAEVQVQLAPRQAEVTPEQLPRLAQDLQRLQQAVGGVIALDAEAARSTGFLGFGRRSERERTQVLLDRQIERNTAAIEGGQLAEEELADALCERAEAQAERGRADPGLADARRAVEAAPVHGRAHACLGQLLFAVGRFAEAVPAYTRAVSLGEDAAQTLMRRGHARFYAGEHAAAAQDFRKAAALLRTHDAGQATHAELWQAWALRRAGLPLPDVDTAAADADWPRSALALARGALQPEQLLDRLRGRLDGDALQRALGEAWFHLGQHYRIAGDAARARQAFENARSQGLPVAVETLAAGFELAAAARPSR